MSTAGSSTGIDERLARLAPTASPDPERLAAARAVLDDVLDETLDGDRDGSGPSRSRRVGDAHVLDLDDARARRDAADGDAPLPLVDDDLVVPLDRGRTARERRRRRVQLGAAAAGVVGVVAVGLVLAPRPAPGPASPESSCAEQLTASLPERFDLHPAWSSLAHDTVGGASLTMLRSPEKLTGFCADTSDAAGSTRTNTLWTDPAPTASAGEVTLGGVMDDDWYVAWGDVGSGARDVRLQVEPPRDAGAPGSLLVVDTVRDGAGWTVMLPGDRVPTDARVSLLWREDGTARSLALDSAWPEDGEAATALTEQRRQRCTDGPDVTGLRPLIERRYDDLGLTAMMNDRRELVMCVQDAYPPYQAWTVTSGRADAAPARDVAAVEIGTSTDGAHVLTGFAGADVERVELETEDGTVVPAELSDGYWVAWSTTSGGDILGEAQLVWYLDDGSRHED
ncbi:hypothetical protein ACFQ8E_15375 [Isoptericola sp. NPDC056573]|uniref:hypothetical protein n=1 Tax=Isoptericola sp. NPDC056573 TaxID=3345868 RepID=UPI0036A9019D